MLRAGYAEIQRAIREVEAPRPSERSSMMGVQHQAAAAKRRKTDTRGLKRALTGDIDWILMRCLEKDRTRRYQTANELALEIERFLQDEPVQAGPPSTTYRLRKFVRRNRVGVLVATVVTVSLLAGIVVATLGLVRAEREHKRAEVMLEFYERLLGGVNPLEDRADTTPTSEMTVSQLLIAVRDDIDDVFGDRPDLQVRIRRVIGQALWGAGAREEGDEQLRAGAWLAFEHLPAGHPDALDAYLACGTSLVSWRSYTHAKDALTPLRQGRNESQAFLGDASPMTVQFRVQLGWAQRWLMNYEEAAGHFEEALKHCGENRDLRASALSGLAYSRLHAGDLEGALQAAELGQQVQVAAESPYRPTALSAYAEVLTALGRHDDAVEAHHNAYLAHDQVYGWYHPFVILPRFHYTYSLMRKGSHEQAIAMLDADLERLPRNPRTAEVWRQIHASLADVYWNLNDLKKARRHLNDAYDVLAPPSLAKAHATASLATVYIREGKLEDAGRIVASLLSSREDFEGTLNEYRTFYPEVSGLAAGHLLATPAKAWRATPFLDTFVTWREGADTISAGTQQIERLILGTLEKRSSDETRAWRDRLWKLQSPKEE